MVIFTLRTNSKANILLLLILLLLPRLNNLSFAATGSNGSGENNFNMPVIGDQISVKDYLNSQRQMSTITHTASGTASLEDTHLIDVLLFALHRNRSIKGAKQRIESAESRVVQARSIFGLKLTGNFQHTRVDDVGKTVVGGQTIPMGKTDSQTAYMEVTQPIFLSGKDRYMLNSARLGRSSAKSGQLLTQQQILLETTLRWQEWLFAGEAERVGQKDFELAKAHHVLVSNRFKHKQASQFELLRAEVRLAQAQSALRNKINNRELAGLDLLNTIDLPGDTPITTKDRLQMIDLEVDLENDQVKALELREDIRMKQFEVNIAQQAIASAKSENQPVVSLFGQSGYQDPSSKSSMGNYERKGYWRAGVVANFTLTDGGMRAGKIKEAQTQFALAEIELKEAIEKARIEIKQAFLNIETAKEVVASQHKALKQAEEALRLSGVRYANGLITQVELFDAENAYLATRLQFLQAILSYHQAYASYRLATGQLGRKLISDSF
jgi:outer membrane protein TolC